MSDAVLNDDYAELVASLDEDSASYGFVAKEWENGIDKILNSLNSDYTWIGAGTESEDVFYKFLASEFNMLNDAGKDHTYEITSDTKNFEVLRARLNQHFSKNYDSSELVGILRAEYPDTSQRRFRSSDSLPSEQPFKDRFGNWSNAHWCAGLRNEEQVDRDLLIDQLVRETHFKNNDSDMLVETLSAREIDEKTGMHNKEAYQNAFGSIENAYREAGLETVRKLEKEMKDWRNIIYPPHSDLVPVKDEDVGHRI